MSEQETQFIPIYYGDDTDFHNRTFVTVSIDTTMDLSGMTATLYLGQLKKDYSIVNNCFEIKLSSNETKTLPFGQLYGRISLFDSSNRRRTISSEVPFFVSKKVADGSAISITLDVEEESAVAYVTTQMKAEQLAEEAETAATNAANSATAAATSATNAANSASAAASSATAAETAESNASTHASSAVSSASSAAQSALDAANSASQAAQTLANKIDISQKASTNGVASLDANGKVPANQLPIPVLTWYSGVRGTSVTIADTALVQLVKVYKNGVLLQPTEDYSISGTTLTLVTEIYETDKICLEVF